MEQINLSNKIYRYSLQERKILDENEVYNWLLYWTKPLQKDSEWKNIKFKTTNYKYPPFEIPVNMVEEVDRKTFWTVEQNRIPLFIGTQFGVCPISIDSREVLARFNNGFFAILSKSGLSGVVVGVKIYQIIDNQKILVKEFPNKPID